MKLNYCRYGFQLSLNFIRFRNFSMNLFEKLVILNCDSNLKD